MSELGELLALLHDGGAAGRPVRATVRTWSDTATAQAAFERGTEEAGAAGWYAYAEVGEPAPAETTTTTRLWLAPPDRARIEDGDEVLVTRGPLWWRFEPGAGATSNQDEPDVSTGGAERFRSLLEPARLLGDLRLEPRGRGVVNGRAALFALATLRARDDDEATWELHDLGFGADAWELAVDVELGVLLRVEALHDGRPFQRIEVAELAVGEPIDDDVFVFTPPGGVEIQRINHHRLRLHVSLDEVVAAVPFAVFVPERLDPGWEVELMLFEASGHRGDGPWVQVRLSTPDRQWAAGIRQAAADDPVVAQVTIADADPAAWREHDGLRIREPSTDWAPAAVRLEREGTLVELTSNDLGAERLIELAGRLVRAPDAPPAF